MSKPNGNKGPGSETNTVPAAAGEDWSPAEYLRVIRNLLAKGQKRDASELLQTALARHPDDPFLLSYNGYIATILGGSYRSGIETCEQAVRVFEKRALHGDESHDEKLTALLYLNLGRTYLAGGERMEAHEALQKGLRFDRTHREILAVLEKMGVRRYVPVPFLNRSNPINRLVGRMFRRTEKKAG